MPYSSDLAEGEWETFEPLLLQILPTLKADSPVQLDKARNLLRHSLSTEKWL
jgi:hypothetical protein